ncbi:MAG TPA: division/cell wall cluster transcriptional repressor MraZ [Planctomycetota bacterium]|nr:division/cell wall cluster transcriptional repressor MraZ [Planctomycetota bacterium]
MLAFTGQYTHTLDEKHRVSVPRKILETLRARDSADEVVVTAGLDGCLFLYTRQGFEAIARQVDGSPLGEESTRDFQRNFYSSTERCPVDGSGRFLLGDTLRALAGISDRVTFVGGGQRVELWQPEAWIQRQTRTRSSYTTQAKDVLR